MKPSWLLVLVALALLVPAVVAVDFEINCSGTPKKTLWCNGKLDSGVEHAVTPTVLVLPSLDSHHWTFDSKKSKHKKLEIEELPEMDHKALGDFMPRVRLSFSEDDLSSDNKFSLVAHSSIYGLIRLYCAPKETKSGKARLIFGGPIPGEPIELEDGQFISVKLDPEEFIKEKMECFLAASTFLMHQSQLAHLNIGLLEENTKSITSIHFDISKFIVPPESFPSLAVLTMEKTLYTQLENLVRDVPTIILPAKGSKGMFGSSSNKFVQDPYKFGFQMPTLEGPNLPALLVFNDKLTIEGSHDLESLVDAAKHNEILAGYSPLAIPLVKPLTHGILGGESEEHHPDLIAGGNIVVTPPHKNFPFGRLCVGSGYGENDVDFNVEKLFSVMKDSDFAEHLMGAFISDPSFQLQPELRHFFQAQILQKPVEIFTSWLYVGHADEIVNFVPTKKGFKVLLASPQAALQKVLELSTLVHKKSASPVVLHLEDYMSTKVFVNFKGRWERYSSIGTEIQVTLQDLAKAIVTQLKDKVSKKKEDKHTQWLRSIVQYQYACQFFLDIVAEQLKQGFGLSEEDIIPVPVFYFPAQSMSSEPPKAFSFTPNPINYALISSTKNPGVYQHVVAGAGPKVASIGDLGVKDSSIVADLDAFDFAHKLKDDHMSMKIWDAWFAEAFYKAVDDPEQHQLVFVDDSALHETGGDVHCATNTLRGVPRWEVLSTFAPPEVSTTSVIDLVRRIEETICEEKMAKIELTLLPNDKKKKKSQQTCIIS